MYKVLIPKHLKILTDVTIILLTATVSGQQNKVDNQKKFTLANQLIPQLGASSYKKRKAAVKGLIELGYFARNAVKEVLDSNDPEVRENAKTVWEKIRWAVTEKNPELVNEFIEKYKDKKANLSEWVTLVDKCGTESVDVIIELIELTDKPIPVELPEDVLDEPAIIDDGLSERDFGIETMMPIIIYKVDSEDLKKSLISYNDLRKKKLKKIIDDTLKLSSPYTQSRLLGITAAVLGADQAWEAYLKCDVSSKYLLRKMPQAVIEYVAENFMKVTAESKIRSCLVLNYHKKLAAQKLAADLPVDAFHQCSSKTQKIFFEMFAPQLSKETRKQLLTNGNEPWHKYRLLKLNRLPDSKSLTNTFSQVFTKGGDIVEFIEENFPFGSENAIPFYLIEAEMESKNDDWFLYSTSTSLMKHFHRIGDFTSASKFLRMFNDENKRLQDTNEAFYADQGKLIKNETVEILKKVQKIMLKNPGEADRLLSEALKLNPQILIVKILKIEALIKLNKREEARILLKEAVKSIPANLLEIRDLVYLSWEANDKESAEALIKKLNLSEENYSNITLASSSYEFFLNMDKTEELQESIGLNSFAKTRKFFYEKKYDQIPPICQTPDEGDFQYIWGVISLRITEGKTQAVNYFSKRIFDELWPEMLGLCLAGKITPEEIIEEASACLNLTERQGRLTEAYYYAACSCIADKKTDKAKEYLKKALSLSFYEYYEYVAAKVLLEKLD